MVTQVYLGNHLVGENWVWSILGFIPELNERSRTWTQPHITHNVKNVLENISFLIEFIIDFQHKWRDVFFARLSKKEKSELVKAETLYTHQSIIMR